MTTLFGHTLYLSYTKERLSQEVSRVAERRNKSLKQYSHLTWFINCCLYSAYFLCLLRQPRGYQFPLASCAGPVPHRLSTPLSQISHTVLLAGLYTNKSNSFYSKRHMYRVRRKSPNSWFVIDILHVPMSACNSSWNTYYRKSWW